jgi:NAD(P)-dependent dehydrogenase (short-subunit alcohol dehydrogenase family)
MDLRGRVVVITGASGGLGRAVAYELARRGCNLVLSARREEALEQTARGCHACGVDALVVPGDVTVEDDVRHLADAALARWQRIDAWINNAGVTLYAELEDGSLEDHRRVIETNLIGAMSCARAAMTVFRRQHHGVLVNVGSVLSHIGQAFVPSYVISKFGVRGLSEALRLEVADEPEIHVCTVYPYAIDTPHFEVAASRIGLAPYALPPVQAPEKVARAIADLCERPRRTRYVPRAAALGVALHAVAPRMVERLLLDTLRRWHLSDRPQAIGPGNLYTPVREHAMVHGHRQPLISTASMFAWVAVRLARNGAAAVARGIARAVRLVEARRATPLSS